MFKFYLTTQESYIIFAGLQKIFNLNLNNNDFIQIIDRNKIYKNDLIFILDRTFIFNDLKLKILDSIEIKGNAFCLKFNKEIFNYFSNEDINFIKSLNFIYKYVSSIKLKQFFYYSQNIKILLNKENLDYIDNNNYLLIEKIKNEKIDKQNNLDKFIMKLNDKDNLYYYNLLKSIKTNDFILFENTLLFKLIEDNLFKIKIVNKNENKKKKDKYLFDYQQINKIVKEKEINFIKSIKNIKI